MTQGIFLSTIFSLNIFSIFWKHRYFHDIKLETEITFILYIKINICTFFPNSKSFRISIPLGSLSIPIFALKFSETVTRDMEVGFFHFNHSDFAFEYNGFINLHACKNHDKKGLALNHYLHISFLQ